MPPTDFQESSSSPSTFTLSILSRRRDQVHSTTESNGQESESESFQKQVAERFQDLASTPSSQLLSLQWLRKLLNTFLDLQDQFRVIISNNKSTLNRPPMDKHITDFFERSVKALDICNAIRDGIEQIRHHQKQLEIVLCAFNNQRSIGEGQFRRAKKALIDLTLSMLEEGHTNTTVSQRNRSFTRNNETRKSLVKFRSLSWSVSRTWSAARQLQAISSNLSPPRANETSSTNGLNVCVFTMNCVLLFVMWALVAAIPCQDRGGPTINFLSRQFVWSGSIVSIYERIMEEWRRRDRRNSCGLMKEIYDVEKCVGVMSELCDCVEFPLTEEREREVRERVCEIESVYEGVKDGLDPLEGLVREAFRRIVSCRSEALDSIGRGANDHD